MNLNHLINDSEPPPSLCFLAMALSSQKQGRIHGNPVADGWAGAVMRKTLGIQKCDGPTDGPTDIPTDTARCRVACPRLKIFPPDAPNRTKRRQQKWDQSGVSSFVCLGAAHFQSICLFWGGKIFFVKIVSRNIKMFSNQLKWEHCFYVDFCFDVLMLCCFWVIHCFSFQVKDATWSEFNEMKKMIFT